MTTELTKQDKVALMVVDMQRQFEHTSRRGYPGDLVPGIIDLMSRFRQRHWPVVLTQHHDVPGSKLSTWKRNGRVCVELGSTAWELSEKVKEEAGADDIRIDKKTTYSAFHGTTLDQELRTRDVKRVVIVGVVSNLCCDATARDAFACGYDVTFLSDGTASRADRADLHEATLLTLAFACAEVLTRDAFVQKYFAAKDV